MDKYILSQIDTYCYLIKRGKPCASVAIKEEYANDIINNYRLNIYYEYLSIGWKTLWIFKDNFMIEIIKYLPEESKTFFEHWILGKAFGYSDEAIKDFLETKVLCK
jgi:hypothetical protein